MPIPGNQQNVFEMSLDASKLSKSLINKIRVISGITGVIALILGVMVLVWPNATLQVVAFLFGLYFFIVGLFRLGVGIFAKNLSAGNRVLNIVLGLLLVIVGVFALRHPIDSIILLGIIIGIAWIVEGILVLVESQRGPSRWVGITFGILSLVAGIIVLFVPISSIAILVIIAGWFLIILGAIQIIRAFVFGHGTPKTS